MLVFGIATSLTALHRALPYHVSSKVNIHVFSSQPSTTYLNSVVEHVFFADDFPFRLGRKVFNLFTDVFLFYDLSVTGFIKNCKVSRCVLGRCGTLITSVMMMPRENGNFYCLCKFDNLLSRKFSLLLQEHL